LTALLLRANELVSIDYLASAAWERPPPSWRSNVRTYLSAIRRLLPAERLFGTASGYRLVVRPGELAMARSNDHERLP